MKIIKCDHCGQDIREEETRRLIEVTDDTKDFNHKTLYSSGYIELCDKCASELASKIEKIVKEYITEVRE